MLTRRDPRAPGSLARVLRLLSLMTVLCLGWSAAPSAEAAISVSGPPPAAAGADAASFPGRAYAQAETSPGRAAPEIDPGVLQLLAPVVEDDAVAHEEPETLVWDRINTVAAVTAAIMLAGSLFVFLSGGRRTPSEESHTQIHGWAPLIAATSYFAMSIGMGEVVLEDDRVFYISRLIDWSITTPLLLLGLARSAQHSSVRRGYLIASLLAADVYMIVTGVFAAQELGWAKWIWFGMSFIAFAVIYWVLWVPMRAQSRCEKAHVEEAYTKKAGFLSVVWAIYPILFVFSAMGLYWISLFWTFLAFAALDIVAKVVYGVYATELTKKVTDEDLRHIRSTGRAIRVIEDEGGLVEVERPLSPGRQSAPTGENRRALPRA